METTRRNAKESKKIISKKLKGVRTMVLPQWLYDEIMGLP